MSQDLVFIEVLQCFLAKATSILMLEVLEHNSSAWIIYVQMNICPLLVLQNTCLSACLRTRINTGWLSCFFQSTFSSWMTGPGPQTQEPHFWMLPAMIRTWSNYTLCIRHTYSSGFLCRNPASRCLHLHGLQTLMIIMLWDNWVLCIMYFPFLTSMLSFPKGGTTDLVPDPR